MSRTMTVATIMTLFVLVVLILLYRSTEALRLRIPWVVQVQVS
jgi:hypothetical protein